MVLFSYRRRMDNLEFTISVYSHSIPDMQENNGKKEQEEV